MRRKQQEEISPEMARRIERTKKLERLSRRRFKNAGYVLGGAVVGPGQSQFGLAPRSAVSRGRKFAKFKRQKGEYHAMVIAANGMGKGVSALVPAALMHDGQFICVDPKGEITQITARRRREMGDNVVIIDPFGRLGAESHRFNPMELVMLKGSDPLAVVDMCETIAAELGAGHEIQKDMFWWHTATSLLAGLICYAATHPNLLKRNLNTVVDLMSQDDVAYGLAVLMDTEGKKMNPFAYRKIAEFLAAPDGGNGSTRSCIYVAAMQMLHCLQAPRISRLLGHSDFSLNDLLEGEKPLSIFIIFPPQNAKSHRGLLRILLGTIFQVLCKRTHVPSRRTLVCLDEAANIGHLDILPVMHSYGRGFGISMLTAWQSLGQLSDQYPTDWRVITENALIQTFGLHSTAVDPMANFLGVPAEMLRALSRSQQVVTLPTGRPFVLEKIDYRTHPMLSVMADENPVYSKVGEPAGGRKKPGRRAACAGIYNNTLFEQRALRNVRPVATVRNRYVYRLMPRPMFIGSTLRKLGERAIYPQERRGMPLR